VSSAGPDLASLAGRFGHLLHAADIPVTPERSSRFAAALALAFPANGTDLYWLARITLLTDRSQLPTFDRIFHQVFGGLVDPADSRGQTSATPPAHVRAGDTRPPGARPTSDHRAGPSPAPTLPGDGASDETDPTRETVLAAYSAEERLRDKDFGTISPDELADLSDLMRRFVLAPPLRFSRRTARHRHGSRLDVRATLGRARRTGGDPATPVRRRRGARPRRIVVLCDISGSMEAYARAYLQLLHCAVGGARAEAFVFATRLTRVTTALRARNPEVALHEAGKAAPDWSGGTRIGAALKAFNDSWGRRGLARGAVVVIISDGWERDDPALLAREVERLHLMCHRLIWVNPRLASASYQPLVGGMAAALPFCDTFVSGHSIVAMHEVVDAVAGSGHLAGRHASGRPAR
jgi:uncharacterized protein